VTRKLSLVAVQRHWAYGPTTDKVRRRLTPDESIWEHTSTFLRVESEKRRDGEVIEREVRLYNSSLAHDALTPEQWLYLIRAHWGVENNNHHTLPNSVSLRGGRPPVDQERPARHARRPAAAAHRVHGASLKMVSVGDPALGRGAGHPVEAPATVGLRDAGRPAAGRR
jgi:hypothetical protein